MYPLQIPGNGGGEGMCLDTEEEGRKEICAQILKKREGRPVSDTEEEGRKEMCPDTEKDGGNASITY